MLLNYLPAAARPRRAGPPAARGAVDRPGGHPRLPLPRRSTPCSTRRLPAAPGHRHDRGEDRRPRRRRDGDAGDPAALRRGSRRRCRRRWAATSRPTATASRMARAGRGEGRAVLGLERAPGVAYEAFHIGKPIGVDELRLPRRRAAGVRPLLAPADLLPDDHQHPARGRHRRGAAVVRHRQEDAQRPVASWLTMLAHDRGRQRGHLRAAAADRELRAGSHPPRRSPRSATGRTPTPAAGGTAPTRRSGRSSRRTGSAGTSRGSAASARCTAHPLASCRIGDDPATSALDDRHELRGPPGLFVTDGSAVPTSLTVNPSLTIAALAERASVAIARSATDAGIALTAGVPAPGNG